MATFITTKGISTQLEHIICSADKHLILLSPFVKFSTSIAELLIAASDRGVQIQLVYGKDKQKLKAPEWRVLNRIAKLQLYYHQHLHVKCYFNEETMIITSMNLYEYSQRNNNEYGVLINRKEDKSMFDDAFRESLTIINQVPLKSKADLTTAPKKFRGISKPPFQLFKIAESRIVTHGCCIICSESLPFNLRKPMCLECYDDWKHYEDFGKYETVCHICGDSAETTIKRPQCNFCYHAGKVQVYV